MNLRNYYSSALDSHVDNTPAWSSNPTVTSDSSGNIAAFGVGTAAIAGAGFLPLGRGNVWDKYVAGMRGFEEYFFGRIPRTLQLSNIFSQFETASTSRRLISPQQLGEYSGGQLDYLERLTGTPSHVLSKEGLRFESGKLFLGDSGKTILSNASVIRNINKSPRFSEGYARSLGQRFTNNLFGESLSFTDSVGKETSEVFQFIGGKSRAQGVKRQLFGIGTELIERVNRLAKAPFEFPVIGPILSRLPFKFNVRSAGGLETLARLTGKLGLIGSAAVLGYQTADYAVRNTDLLNNTIFDKGITTGIANIWANANLAKAKFGDSTGWTEYSKEQERIAPGSTSLLKLSAFPVAGAIGGAGVSYLQRIALTGRLQARGRNVATASDVAARVLRRFEGSGFVSRIGRRLRESSSPIIRSIAESPLGVKAALGAAIGLIPILPFLPGALAPGESEEELHDIYTGKKEIAVRKGRFWELGNSAYEGGAIDFYRPGWFARLQQGGAEKQIWGPLETDGELSPLQKFYRSNFTYDIEEAHFKDRPYPESGKSFYNIPIVGPLLSSTIGQIIKPTQYYHTDEFLRGDSYKQPPLGFGQDRAVGLGEELPGTPIPSHGLKSTIGEQVYRMSELTGLPGFLANTIKQKLTGTQDLFDQEPILASADTIDSPARSYWDLSLGGLAGSNELFRRLLPHKRNQIDVYNPIKNNMPDWMPSSGQRSRDFQHGDPFSAVPEGEIRLPGAGYATRFPELTGVDPRDYPLIHKYKILADIAPFSESFQDVEQQVAIAYRKKQLSPEDTVLYHQTQEQLDARREKKSFDEYLYQDKQLNPVQQALADWNKEQGKAPEEPSWFDKTVGNYWQQLAHRSETALEQLTPVSPIAKLAHMRTAIEDYERDQVFGTGNKFWDRPIANFIRPFVSSVEKSLGDESIPGEVQERRNLEEYFDILKYLKFSRLKNMAAVSGDKEATSEFEQKRRETLFGINPYSFDYSEIFRALPRRDRDYFTAFSETNNTDDRVKILSLIPENEKALYIAKWQQSDNQDFLKASKLGLLSQDEVDRGMEAISEMQEEKDSEGLPKTRELFSMYISERLRGESYPDWYRRTRLVDEKAQELGFSIPGPDFVGFRPEVDLEDIKLKVVENLGANIQDYDLWPSREKALLLKTAFINDEAIAPITQKYDNSFSIRRIVKDVLSSFDISDLQINVSMSSGDRHLVNMDIQDDRTNELRQKLNAQ